MWLNTIMDDIYECGGTLFVITHGMIKFYATNTFTISVHGDIDIFVDLDYIKIFNRHDSIIRYGSYTLNGPVFIRRWIKSRGIVKMITRGDISSKIHHPQITSRLHRTNVDYGYPLNFKNIVRYSINAFSIIIKCA